MAMADLAAELTLVSIGYNSEGVIANHFDSFLCSGSSQTSSRPRWLFVDNASTDRSDDILKGYQGKVEHIKNSDNLGFGAACNIGIHAATSRYVLILNPDTELSESAVISLLEEMKKHGAGIVGPKLKPSDKTGVHPVSWLVGAVLLLDKQKMDAVGYFDEDFFLYEEDVDICKRANDAGLKVLHCHDISIPHVGGGSTERNKSVNYFIHFHKGRSYVIFNRKHGVGDKKLEQYLRKNKRRRLLALLSFGVNRFKRAQAKLDGAYSVLKAESSL